MSAETLDDIVAELRADANAVTDDLHNDDCWTNVEAGRIYDSLAYRIEAAAAREKAVTDALLACKDKMTPHPDPDNAPPLYSGNATAMRAALEEQLRYWNTHIRTRDEENMRVRTEAALSAPPRNCDVGTAEEQSVRMDAEYCLKQIGCYESQSGKSCPLYKEGVDCRLMWAQMPYEEGGRS